MKNTTKTQIDNFIKEIDLNESTISDYNELIKLIKNNDILIDYENTDGFFERFEEETLQAFKENINNIEKNEDLNYFYDKLNFRLIEEIKRIEKELN